MKITRSAISVVLWGFLLGVASASDNLKTQTSVVHAYQPRQLSIHEYLSELEELSALAGKTGDASAADQAITDLRGGWKIQANGQELQVDTDWLIDQFEKLKSNSNSNSNARDQLLERINALKADAEAFQQTPRDSTSAHAVLSQILARGEFHQVHGPTWWDRLKFKIGMWIFRLLSRFFGSSTAPLVGRAFVWTLVAVAVIVLAFFVYRTIRQNVRFESIMPEVLPVSAKEWRVWMEEARAAAAKGLWRDAVHLAYWAGISFLEGNGMWRPDQARTPREYLRLLPAGSQHRSTLSTLTRQLESTWYGNQPAGPETFSETLSNLENLGCRQA